MNNISINNKQLAKYIMFKLDKNINLFSNDELNTIKSILIENPFEFVEITLFSNLEDLTIRNLDIKKEDFGYLLKLSKLSKITFEKCRFENISLLASLSIKELSIVNCHIENYSFLSLLNLDALTIINGNIEIQRINKMNNLKFLQLSHCTLTGDDILYLPLLEELYIDNTNVNDLSFALQLTNLHKLSISENQFKNNKHVIDKLLMKNIMVYNEDIIQYERDDIYE